MNPISMVLAAWLADKIGVKSLSLFTPEMEPVLEHVGGDTLETAEEWEEEEEGRVGFR